MKNFLFSLLIALSTMFFAAGANAAEKTVVSESAVEVSAQLEMSAPDDFVYYLIIIYSDGTIVIVPVREVVVV